MSVSDDELVDRMAKKHAVSSAAVHVMLAALRSGGGRMAQFSHADFGGMSQWSPGMSMVGDMFNTQLKAKLDALCSDIAGHLDSSEMAAQARAVGDEVSYRSTERSADWWPAGLGRPGAVGCRVSRRPPAGDRRPKRDHSLRHGISPDFRRRAGPEQRPNPLVHQPGWARQDRRPTQGRGLTFWA
jgi:hypothetical protein